jgi:hypothetical protein
LSAFCEDGMADDKIAEEMEDEQATINDIVREPRRRRGRRAAVTPDTAQSR